MKRLVGIALGMLFLGVAAFAFNGYAHAAPGHGHGGHGGHGGHVRHGHGGHHRGHGHLRHGFHRFHRFHRPAVYWGVGSEISDEDCYVVRRCHTNAFGITRCRRVQVCD
ncbi:MAG: hypothetical protein RDU20_19250 [Desulfomonilaceae bacterium]|nr:hypothetical protein [Desulfomonilaceae bacterium]